THVSERAYREAQPTIDGKPSQRGAADGYRDLGRPHGPFSPTGPAWISIVGPGSSSPFGETNTIWITCGGPVGITSALWYAALNSGIWSQRNRVRGPMLPARAACSTLGCDSSAIIASSFFRPNFSPSAPSICAVVDSPGQRKN